MPSVEELLEQMLNELKALREEVVEMHEDLVDLLSEEEVDEETAKTAEDAGSLDSQINWEKAE